MSVVSLREGERRAGREEQDGEEDIEERLTRVFRESVEDTLEALKETSEEARKTEAVPSAKKVEEHNLDTWAILCSEVGARALREGKSRSV